MDAAGNVLSQTNARNQAITFTFDALNRPLSQNYPGAARALAFTYGPGNRLTSVQEEEGSRSFTYNTLGSSPPRPTRRGQPLPSSATATTPSLVIWSP